MAAFIAQNCKLLVLFVLVGTVVGLSRFGGENVRQPTLKSDVNLGSGISVT